MSKCSKCEYETNRVILYYDKTLCELCYNSIPSKERMAEIKSRKGEE